MSVSFVIYATSDLYLGKTLEGLFDNTPIDLIDNIIICNDGNFQCSYDKAYWNTKVKVLHTDNVGRAKAWNAAIEHAGDIIIFMKSVTKFSNDWLQPILHILNDNPSALVSPVVYLLDVQLWSSEPNRWKRFGWRWDLELYNRQHSSWSEQNYKSLESPAISSYCIAVNKKWFVDIGKFDDGMVVGSGEDLELSIRNYLFGGQIYVADDSIISCAHEVDVGFGSVNNRARIIEVWLKDFASLYYNIKQIDRSSVNTGRLNELLRLKEEKQTKSIKWYLSEHLPELYGIYSLKGIAANKRIAVVNGGPSLDYIDNGYINSFDIIIGVDYASKLFDCDYVVTDSVAAITDLRAQFKGNRFVLPMLLENRSAADYVLAAAVVTDSYQFEYGQRGSLPNNVNPPFCNFDNPALAAVHFALFLNPEQITLFGYDNKLIDGRSHTIKVANYDDGKIWPDSDSTRRNLAYYEYCLDKLGKLGNSNNIPVLRFCHA